MVKEGDTLTIIIAPKRDGSDGGYVKSVTPADGKTSWFQGTERWGRFRLVQISDP